MANGLEKRPADTRGYLRLSLLSLLCLGAPGLRADFLNDLLVVPEPGFRHNVAQLTLVTDPCLDAIANDDLCAPDIDGDAVPDFRDICLPPSSNVAALRPPVAARLQNNGAAVLHNSADSNGQKPADSLGCANDDPQVLVGVHFQSGQYYLDVASRHVLDRVARALQSMPEQRFEISSHTNNAGRVDINQRLSEGRAKAVRHYLLVRGVDAGQLRTRGYGESMPAYDNVEAAGRRANRRTELRRLD